MRSIVHNRINPDETVIVRSRHDIIDWCNKHNITVAEFNQFVIIPDSVTNCSEMFGYCEKFNQSIVIPGNVGDCSYMFTYCENFNQPIIISNGVRCCYQIFNRCRKFNQSVTIPKSVTNWECMFKACTLMKSKITVYNEEITDITLCCKKSLIVLADDIEDKIDSGESIFDNTNLF